MTKNMTTLAGRWITALVVMLGISAVVPAQTENIFISGVLVAEPCTLDVNDNTLMVDFGTVIEKELYKNVRTTGVPLTITLTDCDISQGKTVSLTLTGAESKELAGALSTTGANSTNIGIVIETQEGKNVPVNQAISGFELKNGKTEIALKAYVQAVPDAIKRESLIPGVFTATAVVNVEYP